MRKASSMIELVIAIVVMGIAMMALPLMLTRTQSNNEFAMQQEAILAARTQIGDILSYRWDENSINSDLVSAVLDTDSPTLNFKRYPDINSTRRIGHIKSDKRRKYFTASTPASAILGPDGAGNLDDIDDFKDTNKSIITNIGEEAAAGLDYRFDFNMSTNVVYVDDNFILGNPFIFKINATVLPIPNATSNIKMIEIKTTGANINNFVLRAYSANIGEGQLLRRDY